MNYVIVVEDLKYVFAMDTVNIGESVTETNKIVLTKVDGLCRHDTANIR